MKNAFRRLVAGVATIALLLTIAPISKGLTIDMSSGNEPSYVGTTITVNVFDTGTTNDFDFATDNVSGWSVRQSDGTLVVDDSTATIASPITNAVGSFTINDPTLLFNLAADTYSVSFTTVAGEEGAAILSVLNDNEVAVTARVEATLAFALNSNALDLGALTPGVYSTGVITYDLTTNSASGATIVMESDGLQDAGNEEIGETDLDSGSETLATNSDYKVSTYAGANPIDFQDASAVISTEFGADMAASQTIYSGTGADSVSGAPITIGADPGDADNANYSDTLRFIVSADF